jgi:hypothetical protein
MLFWKLIVAVDLLVISGYWVAVWKGKERITGFDFVSLPIGLLGSLGLTMYAFSLTTPSVLFWRYFLPVFIASAAWEVAKAANTPDFDAGTLLGVCVALLLIGLTAIALYRLGGSTWIGVLGL